jgi:hypothetical protein
VWAALKMSTCEVHHDRGHSLFSGVADVITVSDVNDRSGRGDGGVGKSKERDGANIFV